MGVSVNGKSTIGNLLSKELHISFIDGDDFYPEDNILKMSIEKASSETSNKFYHTDWKNN